MAALRPLVEPKIIKKMVTWPQSDQYVKIRRNWRKPSGIDNRVRRGFKGHLVLMPNIGYGSNKRTKHVLPSSFWKFLVHHAKKPEVRLLRSKPYDAEVAHKVSSRNHKAIVERAAQPAIRLTNPNVTLCSEENE
ncbi:60S ribosomal protein L32-like [Cebus imitator]|uniref:60S ribosomal protein L32-like n=1 Tax=Cebus imitator TaxID=2715852 RepID=UPI001898CC20|nr:60S ribosomal protein L32-like [Cebus imitator]